MDMKVIRVLLADDHTLVRAGFCRLLEGIPGIEVVGEASDGREAVEMIETKRPDMVLMDIGMPGLNGLEATARVTHDLPGIRVIILSMHSDKEYVLKALRAGASGYLLKDADINQLEMAIKAVAEGETFLSPSISRHVISDYVNRVGAEPSPREELTPRQREILQLIAEGRSKQDIAQMLGVSLKTVETHRDQMMERLGIYDVAGLVRYAIRTGIVTSE
jgi:DNA-binding NarL/FixJ family response regulator